MDNNLIKNLKEAIKNAKFEFKCTNHSFGLVLLTKVIVGDKRYLVFNYKDEAEINGYFKRIKKLKTEICKFVKDNEKYKVYLDHTYKHKTSSIDNKVVTAVVDTPVLDTNIVFVYDESGSMSGSPHTMCFNTFNQLLTNVKEEVVNNNLEANTRFSFMAFDHSYRWKVKDAKAINFNVDNFKLAGGSTNIIDAMYEAAKFLDTKSGNKQIMLFTDGGHNETIINKDNLKNLLESSNILATVYSTYNAPENKRFYTESLGIPESNIRLVSGNTNKVEYDRLVTDATKGFKKVLNESAKGQTVNTRSIGFYVDSK
jgi:hypothetical protein